MEEMTVRLVLDRIEEDVAVLTDGDGTVYECPASLLPESSREDSHFDAVISDGIKSLTAVSAPDAGKNRQRLLRLFGKHEEDTNNAKGNDENED